MTKLCFVSTCQNSCIKYRRKVKRKYRTVFKVPRDNACFEKWKNVLKIMDDKDLTRDDYICAVHFKDDDIITIKEVYLPDGTVHIINRQTPILKKDAVPSIFTKFLKDASTYYETNVRVSSKNTENEGNLVSSFITYHDFSFSVLSENLIKVKKPNRFWGLSVHENFIMCARWNRSFIVEKKIVISEDLTFRVFVCDTKINFDDYNGNKITCFDDVPKLLCKVEDYKL